MYGIELVSNVVKTGVYFGVYMHNTNATWPYTRTEHYLLYSTVLFFAMIAGIIVYIMNIVINTCRRNVIGGLITDFQELHAEIGQEIINTETTP